MLWELWDMRLLLPCVTLALVPFAGCSHAPTSGNAADPRALLAQACQPGLTVKSAKGSVWLKAKSKEASGQFPAVVDAPSVDKLKLEVTNLIGGTEAILTVEGHRYKIEVPNHKERDEQGESSWGGIPLQWANALFLGRIPCPDAELAKTAAFSQDSLGNLVVETPSVSDHLSEKYVYHLRPLDGGLWPDTLHWERKGIAGAAPVAVEFKFEDPDSKTHSPKKWEAKGSQGEVRVRWKERITDLVR
jgi:hypothetical protein